MHLFIAALCGITTIALFLSATSASGSDTAPFLAFSSRQSDAIDKGFAAKRSVSHSTPYISPREIINGLTRRGSDICNIEAIAVVEVDSLQPHVFQTLPRTSYIRSRSLEAPSQIAFPHVSLSHGDTASELRHALQLACRKVWNGADRVKTIVASSMHDEALSSPLSAFSRENPNHLIVITSASRKLLLSKRADLNGTNSDTDPVMDSNLGLLHRYQFFSTGLLIALLVMALLLLPAVYTAVSLLSSIETPDRLGEMTRSSGDKKSQ